MTFEELKHLVNQLRELPQETEWVEFKHNNEDPQEIGEYISALSNSCALYDRNEAYILWGVEDKTHNLVGTAFRPSQRKKGNEELENWLLRLLSPKVDFRIYELEIDGKEIVLMAIPPATHQPIGFNGVEYIRVGSYKKTLKSHPEKERTLWSIFSEKSFEDCIAYSDASSDEVLSLIDYPACFKKLGIPFPENRQSILERLVSERIVEQVSEERFNITNVGAILFSTDLSDFKRLFRKAPRVVVYNGINRIETIKEHSILKGYAICFEELVSYVCDQLPQNEHIEKALRHTVQIYPEIAIRELIANALIHQDFNMTGTGPMIEIFSDRMEITSPGLPLIDTLRFIDEPPQSRNEVIAALMRRMNYCEERGSGIDKVIFNVEAFQLPAPDFRTSSNHTQAVLFGPREFSYMDRNDRIRACYQHACLWYVSGKQMTNASLRERLKIDKSNYPLASRIIRDALDAELIKQPGTARKDGYVPFWA